MNTEGSLLEKLNVAIGLVPVDTNDGANTGLRIPMINVRRLLFIFAFGDSTAAVTNFTLNQHDAQTSGNSKVLAQDTPYYRKVHGSTPSAFTKVTPVAAASNFVPTALAGDPGIIAFEVLAESLDRENGFNYVSIDMIDSTAAKLGACIVLAEPMYHPGYALDL